MDADPQKLYAVCHDREGRLKWGDIGTVTTPNARMTELHIERTPTGPWGWKAYLFPAGGPLPELPQKDQPPPRSQPQKQPAAAERETKDGEQREDAEQEDDAGDDILPGAR